MQLRVRAGGRTGGGVKLQEETPTLRDLRRDLSSSLLPSLGYSSDVEFAITLNGKDALTADEETLASCGIIPGDLIILLLPGAAPSPAPRPTRGHCQPSDPPAGGVKPTNMADTSRREEPRPGSYPQSVAWKIALEEGTSSDWLSEPMLIRESSEGRIPHSLESLYTSAGCTSANDALMTVLHLLMLETGYIAQQGGGKAMTMPEEWRHNDGVYQLHYTHPLCGDSSSILTCVPMGKLLIVNATLKVNSGVSCAKRLQLPTNSYIAFPGQDNNVSSVFRDLRKLSRLFKDRLVYPFLAATRQALELPDVFGLLVLPLELKLRIFRLLDIHSFVALSATCKDLHTDADDPSLWKFMYKRDFRDKISWGPGTDWKEQYKKTHTVRTRNPYRPHPPFAMSPIFPSHHEAVTTFPLPPGIIGGEYDERPMLPIVGDRPSIFSNFRWPAMDPLLVNPPFAVRGRPPPRRSDIRRAFL